MSIVIAKRIKSEVFKKINIISVGFFTKIVLFVTQY